MDNIDDSKLVYVCEHCGLVSRFPDPEAAFNAGWDYPTKMGTFGVVSPRTCGNCGIETTVWWQLAILHVEATDLSSHHQATLRRILNEPASIMVPSEYK